MKDIGHKVAYQGFYFKPDRIHEHLLDEVEKLCRRTEGMKMTKIRVTRSFFGTYSMHLEARLDGREIESRSQGLDPFRGISQCLCDLESRLSEVSRLTGPEPSGVSVA